MKYKGLALVVVLVAILAIGYARMGSRINPIKPGKEPSAPTVTGTPEVPEPAVFPQTILDATGGTVVVKSEPKRIVSVAPSVTELLFDLGAGARVVGDTTACDWPPAATKVPHIGGFADMSVESIAARSPDLIIADRSINHSLVASLEEVHLPVLVVDAHDLSTSFAAIRMIGRATGQTIEAAAAINGMREKFEAIRKVVSNSAIKPRVLVMYDTQKIYTSGPGTLMDDMITIAGGANVAKSNVIDPESVIQAAPDVIVCESAMVAQVKQLPGWAQAVPAVQNTAYFASSPDATLVRGTPRLAQGALELARFIHPELFTSSGVPAPQSSNSAPASASTANSVPDGKH